MAFFAADKNPTEGAEMSFLQHLEELRWHLVRSAAVIAVLAISAFCLNDFVFDTVIFGPLRQDFISYKALCALGYRIGAGDVMCMTIRPAHLQTLSASEQFFNHMWISFLCGLILGFPFILWEFWKFVRPVNSAFMQSPTQVTATVWARSGQLMKL